MKKFFALLTLLLLALSGCSAGSDGGASGSPTTITVTDNGWDSQKLHNEIAKLVVEHAYDGYVLTQSTASSTMNWQSIIAGDVDLDIESWTDNVASYPDDVQAGTVVNVGVLVSDSAQGIYVPRYVVEGDASRGISPLAPDLKTVQDLRRYSDIFPDDEDPSKGRLYGSIPGWMADEILYKKYEAYGLDEVFNYVRLGSEASLFASLVSAYNLSEPWVGYCYEPTWIAGKLDLIMLEDEPYDAALFEDGLCAFSSQELKIISGKDFAQKAPDLLGFFQKYRTGSQLISQALAHLDDTGATHEETAVWLLKENDNLLDEWLPSANAAKLRDYLSTLTS
ncbi:MAG: ABC transporter substrate-binding protein [Peptococcaceae bacterium]|jgi:glycine betaine/proline transport system permease protein/glycine betaine/proline transport system substrate-binding protein|nr:ABC transporter substrate-binding protein [Peptococcaceae bacterium]